MINYLTHYFLSLSAREIAESCSQTDFIGGLLLTHCQTPIFIGLFPLLLLKWFRKFIFRLPITRSNLVNSKYEKKFSVEIKDNDYRVKIQENDFWVKIFEKEFLSENFWKGIFESKVKVWRNENFWAISVFLNIFETKRKLIKLNLTLTVVLISVLRRFLKMIFESKFLKIISENDF